jgi:hypothetical protein
VTTIGLFTQGTVTAQIGKVYFAISQYGLLKAWEALTF